MVDDRNNQRQLARYVALAQVGLEMVAPIVLGVLADGWLSWTPWLTVVGALVGFGGGMAHLLAILNGPRGPEGDKP